LAILLGADTLCWHLRIEQAGLPVGDVLDEASALGCECLQVNLHHVRGLPLGELAALAGRADGSGLTLLASGDFLGEARHGDGEDVGVERIRGWLERAAALRSPILRVVSGFYRAELASRPDLVELERRYVVEVLRRALPAAGAAGVALLLENHSDLTAAEYVSIVEEVGPGEVGVFLDLVNPVTALDDPVPVVERLAPLARAGHVKDYLFRSLPTDDGYHRRGFEVLYRYPGEGVADLTALVAALRRGVGERTFWLTVEGLDNRADVADQRERLGASLSLLRELVA
jgi:sugar phosphate isomerase/epimerase